MQGSLNFMYPTYPTLVRYRTKSVIIFILGFSFVRASRLNIIGSQHISSRKPKLMTITNGALKNVLTIFPYFIFWFIRLGRGLTLGRLWSPGDGPH